MNNENLLSAKSVEKPTHEATPITMKSFLEETPPDKIVHVETESCYRYNASNASQGISLPEINLHCSDGQCNGPRFFATKYDHIYLGSSGTSHEFLIYICKNCESVSKTFSIEATLDKQTALASIVKYGERPAFGSPTPARLVSLLGSEKDYFFKGRRCETQGLGIGAFGYYRRIIEERRNNIFDQIIRVSETLNADQKLIEDLKSAKKETQFSKAIEKIKHAIPQALRISGHNPLVLLHSALSEGLHAKTDDECLFLARDIRVVLTELVEKSKMNDNDHNPLTQEEVLQLTQGVSNDVSNNDSECEIQR
jgi:hypothetical protein